MKKNKIEELKSHAKEIRKSILEMIVVSNSSHIATAFSVVEILTVLYFSIMRINPKKPEGRDRDRFILSKGHGAAANYAVLGHRGYFSTSLFKTYAQDGGKLHGHSTYGLVPGIEFSTGSLGHGLPVAVGMAIAAKRLKKKYRVFVVLGDGDSQEGSNWEAIMAAGHYGLDNLVVLVDYNKMQGLGRVPDIMDLEPFADKWRSFKWEVRETDGHSISQLLSALKKIPFKKGKPSVVLAHTVKGKGVSYMEHNIKWHYSTPLDENYSIAVKELEKK